MTEQANEADITSLRAQVQALQQERDEARSAAAESSRKHRSIAQKAGMLRDALIDFTDDESFATPVVEAATKALAEYDLVVYGDGDFARHATGEYQKQQKRAEAAAAEIASLKAALADVRSFTEATMITFRNYYAQAISRSQVAMIQIQQSPTADTRTCDFANVTKETLLASSKQHIADVRRGVAVLQPEDRGGDVAHDTDKLTDIDGFHRDFLTGFTQTGWWDRHRQLNRHHLNVADGVRDDVNLIDVLDFIADCVMAGMARSGSVYPLNLSPELLERAFQNTVTLLKAQVVVERSPGAVPEARSE
jgi:hypothetical protein